LSLLHVRGAQKLLRRQRNMANSVGYQERMRADKLARGGGGSGSATTTSKATIRDEPQ
jgi:hypothetical protein